MVSFCSRAFSSFSKARYASVLGGSSNSGGLGNYFGISPYGPGKLLVTGGGNMTFAPSNATRIYDIAANTWTAGPNGPPGRYEHTLTRDNTGTGAILFGGYGSSGALADTWKFAGNMWTATGGAGVAGASDGVGATATFGAGGGGAGAAAGAAGGGGAAVGGGGV